jgi:2-C-methyl-D-erythritol 4-phosphate cytidylyltransferase
MQEYAIIVAGGKGLRMGTTTPKQFLLLDGKPVIVRTIEQFLAYAPAIRLILVLPQAHLALWEEIQSVHLPTVSIKVTQGGLERFDSVKAGLDLIDQDGLVAIHDAVRPYVSVQTIRDSFKSAERHGSGVAAVPLKDSIREVKGRVSKARDRAKFRLVQTPQTFRVNEIKDAFAQATHSTFTDDASVYEWAGYEVTLIAGSYNNTKITTPEDLKM